MDVLDPQQVEDATRDVDAVFYLIHGMGGADFADTDARAARNMAQAATSSRVGRIVYLSGIVPPVPVEELSEHVASRLDVERLLSASDVPTIPVRAAIVLGNGSTSFEILRQISEHLPIQAIPPWMNSEVQPIAVVDVLDILEACLHIDAATRSYDVGGDERLRYADLLDLYAQLAGLQRPQIDVPLLPTMVPWWLVGQLTDVPSTIVEALVQSLRHDMVCSDDDFLHDLRAQA